MSVELSAKDDLVCPHCEHKHDYTVVEAKNKDGLDYTNADKEYCEDCNQPFLIIEFDEFFLIEEVEEEEEYEDYEYEED